MPYDTNHFHHLRFWVQHVLPLVYDDSLSYYEFLAKVCKYLNHTIDDVKQLAEAYNQFEVDVNATLKKYEEDYHALKEEINHQFDDLETEFNGKFDELKEDYNTKFEQLRREFEQKFTELTTQLTNTLTQMFNDYSSTLNAQFENYTTKTDKAIADFEENINNQFDEHKQDINKQFEEFKTALQQDVEEYKSELDTKFNDYKTSLDNTINDFKTSVTEEIAQHKADVTEEIKQHKQEVTQQITEFENTVNTTVEQYKSDIETSFSTFKTELTQQFDEYKDSIDTQLSAITADIEEFEQEITQKLTDLTGNAIKSVSGQKELTSETTFEEIEENVLYVSQQNSCPEFIRSALHTTLRFAINLNNGHSFIIKPKEKPNLLIIFNNNLLISGGVPNFNRGTRTVYSPISSIFIYNNDTREVYDVMKFRNPVTKVYTSTYVDDLNPYPSYLTNANQLSDIPLNILAYCRGLKINNLVKNSNGLLVSGGTDGGNCMSLFFDVAKITLLDQEYYIPSITMSNDLFNNLNIYTDLIQNISDFTLKIQKIPPLTENVTTACPSQNVLYLFQGLSEISVEDAGLPSGSVFPQGGEMLGYIRFSATGTLSDFVKEVAYLISFATGKAWVALYPTGGATRWTEIGGSGSAGDVDEKIQAKLDSSFVTYTNIQVNAILRMALNEALTQNPNAITISIPTKNFPTTLPKFCLNDATQFNISDSPQYLLYFKGDVSDAVDLNERIITGKVYTSSNADRRLVNELYVTDIYYNQNVGVVLYGDSIKFNVPE